MVNETHTAWVLVSSALVLLMIPGLAFFYGGLVRKKNVAGTIMQVIVTMGVVGVIWVIWGYTLAFGPSLGGFIGDFRWLALSGVSASETGPYSDTISHQTFMIFQGMFAMLTPAVVIGGFAERMKFTSFLVFVVIWLTVVYAPLAHWVWANDGWIRSLGALDFAGGTVVHIKSGVAALVAAMAWASASATVKSRCSPTTCRWSFSAPGFSGLGGLGSTREALWPRTPRR